MTKYQRFVSQIESDGYYMLPVFSQMSRFTPSNGCTWPGVEIVHEQVKSDPECPGKRFPDWWTGWDN